MSSSLESRKAVYRGGLIVEAIPNASLGVLTPEIELLSAPRLKRGQRFDWLYEQMVRQLPEHSGPEHVVEWDGKKARVR
jgi:hypothetical protein